MRLNQKIRYGVACLFMLAEHPHEYINTIELAQKLTIPLAYAQKVMQAMSQSGLVLSQRGFGYQLAKTLPSISALDVIEALTQDEHSSATTPVLGRELESAINTAVGRITLDQLHHENKSALTTVALV